MYLFFQKCQQNQSTENLKELITDWAQNKYTKSIVFPYNSNNLQENIVGGKDRVHLINILYKIEMFSLRSIQDLFEENYMNKLKDKKKKT